MNVESSKSSLFSYSNECVCFLFSSICTEFEAIKQRALAKPATTAELNDIVKYIDNAKGEKSLQLSRRIKVSFSLVHGQ